MAGSPGANNSNNNRTSRCGSYRTWRTCNPGNVHALNDLQQVGAATRRTGNCVRSARARAALSLSLSLRNLLPHATIVFFYAERDECCLCV